MTTLKYEQQAKITQLAAAHTQYVLAKAELRAKVEAEYQNKLRDYELRESYLMNEALNLNVPKTVIGRTIGTTNWHTIAERLSLTADEFTTVAENQQYVVDKANKMFTVNWQEDTNGNRFDTPMVLKLIQDSDGWQVDPVAVRAMQGYNDWIYEDYTRILLQSEWTDAITEGMQ